MTNAPVLFKYNKTSSQGLLIFLLWFFSFVVLSLQPFNHFLDGKKHQLSFWTQVKVLSLLLRIQDSHEYCSARGPTQSFYLWQQRKCFSFSGHCIARLEFSQIQRSWTCCLLVWFGFFPSLLLLICRDMQAHIDLKWIFGPLCPNSTCGKQELPSAQLTLIFKSWVLLQNIKDKKLHIKHELHIVLVLKLSKSKHNFFLTLVKVHGYRTGWYFSYQLFGKHIWRWLLLLLLFTDVISSLIIKLSGLNNFKFPINKIIILGGKRVHL